MDSGPERLCLCEAIAFELLRHATPDERKGTTAQFATLPLLPSHVNLWRDATRLGQHCREAGVNAGSLDLLISATAIHHDAELVTFDSDFSAIAGCTSLRVLHLTRPA